jgi:hypothetical protein
MLNLELRWAELLQSTLLDGILGIFCVK